MLRTGRVAEYLDRIGDAGPLEATPKTLERLHRAHLLAVPFENLDIYLGRPIVLDVDRLVDKIVRMRRGGFCYELNGAFAWLLRALGFEVRLVSARVANERGELSPEFDHLALVVECEGTWLADVGFGESSSVPLRIGVPSAPEDPYAVEPDGDAWMMTSSTNGVARPQYRFAMRSRLLEEFDEMCRFHQTSPESHFTRNRLCSIATPYGRWTVTGRRFVETTAGVRSERELADETEVTALLRDRFGIVL